MRGRSRWMMPHRRLLAVPPTGERVSRAIGHTLLAAAGAYGAFVSLPKSLLLATNPVLLAVWALFMLTSLPAAHAAFTGKYLLEYAALPFMFGGVSIYAVAMAHVVILGISLPSGVGMFAVAAMGCYVVARWFSLNQLLHSPLRLLFRRKFRRPSE